MLDKFTAAVKQLLNDNRDFSARLERLEKVKPAVVNGRDGKDGKDGVSPDIETIVAAVVNELPEPEKIDTKAIVNDVLSQIPKPRDGRDAPAVNVSDVAAIVLAKIPTPKDGKDGRNGPDLETVVKRVKAQVKDGERGERGPKGDKGEPGKDGVSVTDVQLKNNELFVWLDGVKRAVGKIKIPAAPFSPGNMGGGGSARVPVDDRDTAVYVRSADDFPIQNETSITLSAGTVYLICGSFTVAKRFLVEDGALFDGRNTDSHTVTYTGTDTMFTGADANFAIERITINAPKKPKLFDFRPLTPGVKRFFAREITVVSAGDFGDFGDLQVFEISNVGVASASSGPKFVGANVSTLTINKFGIVSNGDPGFIGIDLGATVFGSVLEIENFLAAGGPSDIGISGLANSANVPLGGLAMAAGCEFIGLTPLQNLDIFDIRWQFRDNTPLSDSRNAADLFLENGTEVVVINTVGVFEEIGAPTGPANWASDISARFIAGSDGVLTYVGERSIEVKVSAVLTIEKTGGGSDELEARIALNWVPGGTGFYKSRVVTQNSTPTSVPSTALTTLTQGDNIRVILANNSTTGDIEVAVTSLEITES